MSDKVRINISRLIVLIVIFYCSFILYNTKVLSVREQEEKIEKLEQKIENKEEKKSVVDLGDIDFDIVGALYIPKINLRMVVYNSTNEEAIRRGVGILETTGTLKPENGQNVILTTHNGDDKRDLFMNLHKMKIDDIFFTKDNNGEIVKYRVDNIQEVLPTELFDKMIYDKNSSKMTLLTCTPVGINSHRLLVTATQEQYDKKSLEEIKKEMENSKGMSFSTYEIIIIIILILSIIFLISTFTNKNSNRKESEVIEKQD